MTGRRRVVDKRGHEQAIKTLNIDFYVGMMKASLTKIHITKNSPIFQVTKISLTNSASDYKILTKFRSDQNSIHQAF